MEAGWVGAGWLCTGVGRCGLGRCGVARCGLGGGFGLELDSEVVGEDFEGRLSRHSNAAVECVEDLFASAAVADDVIHPKQAEVVRNRGLGKVEFGAKTCHIAFPIGEEHENVKACFVGEESEECSELIEVCVRDDRMGLCGHRTPASWIQTVAR